MDNVSTPSPMECQGYPRNSTIKGMLQGSSPKNPTYILSQVVSNFHSQGSSELSVYKGEEIYILFEINDWAFVTSIRDSSRRGYIPLDFCELVKDFYSFNPAVSTWQVEQYSSQQSLSSQKPPYKRSVQRVLFRDNPTNFPNERSHYKASILKSPTLKQDQNYNGYKPRYLYNSRLSPNLQVTNSWQDQYSRQLQNSDNRYHSMPHLNGDIQTEKARKIKRTLSANGRTQGYFQSPPKVASSAATHALEDRQQKKNGFNNNYNNRKGETQVTTPPSPSILSPQISEVRSPLLSTRSNPSHIRKPSEEFRCTSLETLHETSEVDDSPNTTKSDTTKGDTTKSDTTKSDTTKSDTTKSDTTKSDTTKSEFTEKKKTQEALNITRLIKRFQEKIKECQNSSKSQEDILDTAEGDPSVTAEGVPSVTAERDKSEIVQENIAQQSTSNIKEGDKNADSLSVHVGSTNQEVTDKTDEPLHSSSEVNSADGEFKSTENIHIDENVSTTSHNENDLNRLQMSAVDSQNLTVSANQSNPSVQVNQSNPSVSANQSNPSVSANQSNPSVQANQNSEAKFISTSPTEQTVSSFPSTNMPNSSILIAGSVQPAISTNGPCCCCCHQGHTAPSMFDCKPNYFHMLNYLNTPPSNPLISPGNDNSESGLGDTDSIHSAEELNGVKLESPEVDVNNKQYSDCATQTTGSLEELSKSDNKAAEVNYGPYFQRNSKWRQSQMHSKQTYAKTYDPSPTELTKTKARSKVNDNADNPCNGTTKTKLLHRKKLTAKEFDSLKVTPVDVNDNIPNSSEQYKESRHNNTEQNLRHNNNHHEQGENKIFAQYKNSNSTSHPLSSTAVTRKSDKGSINLVEQSRSSTTNHDMNDELCSLSEKIKMRLAPTRNHLLRRKTISGPSGGLAEYMEYKNMMNTAENNQLNTSQLSPREIPAEISGVETLHQGNGLKYWHEWNTSEHDSSKPFGLRPTDKTSASTASSASTKTLVTHRHVLTRRHTLHEIQDQYMKLEEARLLHDTLKHINTALNGASKTAGEDNFTCMSDTNSKQETVSKWLDNKFNGTERGHTNIEDDKDIESDSECEELII